MRPRGVKVLSQCCRQVGGVAVTFTVGKVMTDQEMADEGAKRPSEPKDRSNCPETVRQKVRELAGGLGRAMPGFVYRG